MRKRYIIVGEGRIGATGARVLRFATHDGWKVATNAPLHFTSPEAAAAFLRTRDADYLWQDRECASWVGIEGPRGGLYYAASGSRIR